MAGTIMVRDLPLEERPREKLISCGAAALSNAELLAILLRTGTRGESVLRMAERILADCKDGGLSTIVHMSVEELAKINGLGPGKAAAILAAVELGRRLAVSEASKVDIIHGPEDVARFAMPRFRHETKEHFSVMLLNTKNHVLAMPEISKGSLTASIVHPREVFETAVRHSAASMILLHNHPSGDPSPSREDIAVTKKLVEAGEVMDIPVLDHIIIGNDSFASLKQKGLMHGESFF